ncbi:hypothetical protein BDZ94DRAFT_1327079 [Collybia nuda]|uniref:Uncharacterized protein n=1 Tax=Collybia nuda TaxID=64659 RepID=A0A9P5XTJ3_9AGAR|nr:hypothetical protein BDZ94DRAFT_1327079 [Collybia nuda]
MAGLVVDIVKGIQSAVKEDNTNRETFTTGVVAEGRRRWPEYNFVVCHVEHASQWDGIRGQDWDHRHEEVDIVVGGTIGYEIYYARSGIFQRVGDGGYINWAFAGNVQEKSFDGKTLRFASPV